MDLEPWTQSLVSSASSVSNSQHCFLFSFLSSYQAFITPFSVCGPIPAFLSLTLRASFIQNLTIAHDSTFISSMLPLLNQEGTKQTNKQTGSSMT